MIPSDVILEKGKTTSLSIRITSSVHVFRMPHCMGQLEEVLNMDNLQDHKDKDMPIRSSQF